MSPKSLDRAATRAAHADGDLPPFAGVPNPNRTLLYVERLTSPSRAKLSFRGLGDCWATPIGTSLVFAAAPQSQLTCFRSCELF